MRNGEWEKVHLNGVCIGLVGFLGGNRHVESNIDGQIYASYGSSKNEAISHLIRLHRTKLEQIRREVRAGQIILDRFTPSS